MTISLCVCTYATHQSDLSCAVQTIPVDQVNLTQQTTIPEEARLSCLATVQRHLKRHQERLREVLRKEQATGQFNMTDFDAALNAPDMLSHSGSVFSPGDSLRALCCHPQYAAYRSDLLD